MVVKEEIFFAHLAYCVAAKLRTVGADSAAPGRLAQSPRRVRQMACGLKSAFEMPELS